MASFKNQINSFIFSASLNRLKLYVNHIIRIYKDDWLDLIEDTLKKQFPATYGDLKLLATLEKNPLKSIINKISIVYKGNVERSAILEREDAEEGTIQEPDPVFDEVLNNSNWPSLSQTVERYTNLTNQSVVLINYRNARMDYEMFTFDNCEVLSDPEDWQKITCFIHYVGLELPNYDNGASGFRTKYGLIFEKFDYGYAYYLDDRQRREDGSIFYTKVYRQKFKGVEMSPIGDPEELPYLDENGEAFLPIVLFKERYPDTELIDFTSGSDKYDASLNIGVNMALLNQLIKFNSFKQIALTAPSKDAMPDKMVSDPSKMIGLPSGGVNSGGASATVLDMQARIKDYHDLIRDRAQDIASTYGVGLQNFQNSGSAMSGYAIQLSNLDLLDRRSLQMNLYRGYEKELFKKTRLIYNLYAPGEKINEDAKFMIDFEDNLFPTDPNEQATADTINLVNNVITPVDLIMRENPDLDREQARAIYEENKIINGATAATTAPVQPSGLNES